MIYTIIEKITNWFVEFITYILGQLLDGLKIIFNLVIEGFGFLISSVASMLPNDIGLSTSIPSELQNVLSSVNWFFPVNTMVMCLSIFCVSMAVYFAVRPLLKFTQVS